MGQPELIDQVFLRYYSVPTDFENEPQIAAIKIVGIDERAKDGEIIRYQTIALRDDKRPKRVGDKVRTISVDALDSNWVSATQDVALSDREVYEHSISVASDFLSSSLGISESQASAMVTIIAEMTSQSDKRKLSRARGLIEKFVPVEKSSNSTMGLMSISAMIGR